MKYKIPFQKFFVTLVLIALAMMSVGIAMMFHETKSYLDDLQEQSDKELQSVAKSVDSTMLSIYDKYLNELNYVCSRKEFIEAEEVWYDSGDAHALLSRLKDNLLLRDNSIESVTASYNGKVFLSTSGKVEYYMPDAGSIDGYLSVQITSDYQGTPYLSFLQKKGKIVYSANMILTSFYTMVESNSGLKSIGQVIITDEDNTVYVRRQKGNIQSDMLINEGDTEDPLLHMLIQAQKSGVVTTEYYDEEDTQENSYSSVRVSLLPTSKSSNQVFAIGIIKDRQKEIRQLRLFSLKLLMYGSLILGAVFILLYCIRRYYRQEERNMQQIRILQEKKAAMEELNKETLEFAHHQRLETIGQLTSGIAHDFNNLLTPMMGYSLMVMEKLPPEDTESYDNLLEIYNASSKAKKLISRLSDLSRKNTVLTMKYISTDKVIKETLSMLEPSRPKNVELTADLNCSEVWLYGNETQFSQIMMNLIINAFQALEEKGGRIEVSTWANHDKIHVRVKDNGPGIPKNKMKKVFDPFFTTKPIGQGTGLGLAIVSQMVEEHHGVIDLESKEGEGTQFTLLFPIQVFEDQEDQDQ